MSKEPRGAMPLPLPVVFDPDKSRQWDFAPEPEMLLAAATAYANQHQIAPASRDKFRTLLLLIDVQRDFCFPEGSLFVGGPSGTGAMDDNGRLVRFLYQNLSEISEVVCTLDTHYAHQIFFPSFWLDKLGCNPSPNTVVTLADVEGGRYRPDPEMVSLTSVPDLGWLEQHVRNYCRQLEVSGRHSLFLWPPHCLLGSAGHNLVGAVDEARLFHAFARRARTPLLQKGRSLLTENYSALSTEVLKAFDGSSLGQKSQLWIDTLLAADRVILAGQASSHCITATVMDLLAEIRVTEPRLAEKFYLLADCMSPVVLFDPGSPKAVVADFSGAAATMFELAQGAGMNVVASTTPMADWP